MKRKTLFVVAGGSGGHILPALTLASQWKKKYPHGKIIVFTGNSPLEKKIVHQHTYIDRIFTLTLTKFNRKYWWQAFIIGWQSFLIFLKSIFLNIRYKPERIISTGGFLSVPTCIAGRIIGIKIDLYELNVIPGKAVKALFPWANNIYIMFEKTKLLCRWGKYFSFTKKCFLTDYPLRFLDHEKFVTITTSTNSMQTFDSKNKTLFILGGSQGSQLLNSLTQLFIEQIKLEKKHFTIIHQTGAMEEIQWEEWYKKNNIPALTFSYESNIQNYYKQADLIFCRAGAGTLFEIAFFNKRCIVIPLVTHTTNHQQANAQAMTEKYPNLFTVIDQKDAKIKTDLVVSMMYKNLFLS